MGETHGKKHIWIHHLTDDPQWIKHVHHVESAKFRSSFLLRDHGWRVSNIRDEEERENQAEACHGCLHPEDDSPAGESYNDSSHAGAW